ncbi:MAG: NDP-hexose 2,3-dehydratase family protein [Ruminococcus sp.]|nr:NDP-hexose 2,3-dehydratase family protein [Ruminococcus sp.]
MQLNIFSDIVLSWSGYSSPVYSIEELKTWIADIKNKTKVNIKKSNIDDSDNWYYSEDEGVIRNEKNSFFQISGIRSKLVDKIVEQPIILQNEIGYLGIICKIINGTLHFLMQAKIEPGNINYVQISPTIQATKSNFTKQHGGSAPRYLDYFVNAKKYSILYDQIQSEQSSRFLSKRNRNIIILVNEDVKESPYHRWMTLHQIKQFMKVPNLVNMDTRTVLSGIPIDAEIESTVNRFSDKALYKSMLSDGGSDIVDLFYYLNNYKMFNDTPRKLIPLYDLKNWKYNNNNEFECSDLSSFKLIHCDIEIEGREVIKWDQPLIESNGKALFGLFTCVENGVRLFLIKTKPEIGAFDGIEFGPSVQREFVTDEIEDKIYRLFIDKLRNKKGIMVNNVFSEEGGRFYHEENNNAIIEIEKDEIGELPENYFWVTYKTLNELIQYNNILNVQLRNLLSTLEI